jgi:thiaminase/transcriptional activator TenA
MSVSASLWQEAAQLVEEAHGHPFVRGIGDGTLPRNAFRGYVAQDAFFLDAFARAYAMALVRSPDRASVQSFAGLIAGVRDELVLHESYARQWDIDLAHVEPVAATLAYTDFLLATATTGSLAQICAALTPCLRLYRHLGVSLAVDGVDPSNPYASWVRAYADPAFGELTDTLEQLLDAAAPSADAVRRQYQRAMRLELGFFDASLPRD